MARSWAAASRMGLSLRRQGQQLANVHGKGVSPAEVARLPVQPGNSDLCFEWSGPIEDAIEHLKKHNVPVHALADEAVRGQGEGTSVHFRDPDGSLMEFMSYRGKQMPPFSTIRRNCPPTCQYRRGRRRRAI